MKKSFDVLKYKLIAPIPSIAIVLIGLVMFFAIGFNAGIDFAAGLSERIQIAPVGLYVSYEGSDDAVLGTQGGSLVLTSRNASGVQTRVFDASQYPTVSELAKALGESGIKTEVKDGSLKTSALVFGSGFPLRLSGTKQRLNFSSGSAAVSISEVRSALSSLNSVNVQIVGEPADSIFQIRLRASEDGSQKSTEQAVSSQLEKSFDREEIVVLQSDFVGPKFSSSLFTSSIKAILVVMVLILIYISFRFRLAYAISSVVALTHDILMMLSFIVIFRLEVSSTTVAAVLTIIGYSLNATIVIFDRVRENILNRDKSLSVDEIIAKSVRDSFTRTIITSVTTLFAVIPLAIFSSGSIRLFAINLIWGVIVGAYSSNFIAPALLHYLHAFDAIDKVKKKKEDESYHIGDAYV